MTCHLTSLPHWGRFEVQKLCNECNIPLDCQTAFSPNGTVATFGGVTRGSLKADGDDVAGMGIVVAFFLPSAISLSVSLMLILLPRKEKKGGWNAKVPEHAYSFLEAVLRAISDIQILLALALGLSVVVFGVCRTLQYQLNISVNLLLLACTSYLQTLGLTRHYWRSWLASMAALLRFLAVVGIYFCFGWILAIQNTFRSKHQFVAERMPGKNQTDSAVFLKAACFLDPNFQNNTFVALDEAERTHIGLQDNDGPAAEWVLGIILAVVTALVFIGSIPFYMRRSPGPSKKITMLHRVYYAFIWIPSAVVFGYSCSTVSGLRSWVSKSGWLLSRERGSPLDGVHGFGQTAALVLIAAMLIGALENSSTLIKQTAKPTKLKPVKKPKQKHGRGYQQV